MNLKFLGAAGTVTGSGYLVRNNKEKILIDFGMFQGPKEITKLNFQLMPFDPKDLSAVFLTHAHLDHCGRLPVLVKGGFSGKIFMTEATRALTELTLLDAAKLGREGKGDNALYIEEDVEKTLQQVELIDYDQEFRVGSFSITFLDAGHILGSAIIEIKDKSPDANTKKVIFSGDLGNSPEPIVQPTDRIDEAEIVIMESTYGDRTHSKDNPADVISYEINKIEKENGALLIPSFSIERAQEILHLIDHLKHERKIMNKTMVFLDSPMAIKATQIYKTYKELYSRELSTHTTKDDPFDFPGLRLTESINESREIENISGAKVIIAGSGMMTGGRILDHAINYLPHSANRLLIVGYQPENTLGREILDGAKKVRIYDQDVEVNCHVRKSSALSAHADQPKLLKWLGEIKNVQRVYLIHGEDLPRNVLANLIKERLRISEVILPKLYEEFDL